MGYVDRYMYEQNTLRAVCGRVSTGLRSVPKCFNSGGGSRCMLDGD